MRCLVTGGAGFIGSHLVDELIRQGHSVTVLDNLEPQVHRSKPGYLNSNARYIIGDILDVETIRAAIQDVDIVYHLAAMVGVGQSMYQVTRYVDVNVGGTAKLLQFIADGKHSLRKLVVASSMSIYGEGAYLCPSHGQVYPSIRNRDQLSSKDWEVHCPNCGSITVPMPTPESKPIAARSVYAVTKRDQEELCLSVGRAYNLPTVALRFFNVYGPRQSLDNPYTGVAAIFQARIKNGLPPVIFEDGKQTRDFVSVHDVVRALVLAGSRSGADFQALNIGSGRPVSIIEVANVLLKLYKSQVNASVQQKFRAGDIRHCYADIRRANELIGYLPDVSFDFGMRELVEWGSRVDASDHFDQALQELQSKGLVES